MKNDFHKPKKLTLIGLGLMGGSLGAALKKNNWCETIVGYSRNPESLKQALELGCIDQAEPDLITAVKDADMIVLCVPVLTIENILKTIRPALKASAIITDVASVKNYVVKIAEKIFGTMPENFVPAHPIAGSEKSGVQATQANLYQHHKVILTPLAHTNAHAMKQVTAMWQSVGAQVTQMEVAHHDEVLAATSHLPHLIAFSLVDTLAGEADRQEIFDYAAGGFRDFTRIAASDPIMWRDVFLTNKVAALQVLDHFLTDLNQLRSAIEQEQGEELLTTFTRAKVARDQFSRVLEQRKNQNPSF